MLFDCHHGGLLQLYLHPSWLTPPVLAPLSVEAPTPPPFCIPNSPKPPPPPSPPLRQQSGQVRLKNGKISPEHTLNGCFGSDVPIDGFQCSAERLVMPLFCPSDVHVKPLVIPGVVPLWCPCCGALVMPSWCPCDALVISLVVPSWCPLDALVVPWCYSSGALLCVRSL